MRVDLNDSMYYVASCNTLYGQLLTRDGILYNERTMGTDLQSNCFWYFSTINEAEMYSSQHSELNPDREYSIYTAEGKFLATYLCGKIDTRWKT